MNKFIYSNIKISPIYGLSLLRKHINKGITDISIENITNRYKEIELENKKQFNLNFSNINNLKDSNNELRKINLNESNLILMKEQQFIRLISPFNSKLASFTNHIYTFTNKPYKQYVNQPFLICPV